MNVQLGVVFAFWLWFTCLVTHDAVLFSVHVIVNPDPSVSLAQNQQSGVSVVFMVWFMGVGDCMVGLVFILNSNVLLTLLIPSLTNTLQ